MDPLSARGGSAGFDAESTDTLSTGQRIQFPEARPAEMGSTAHKCLVYFAHLEASYLPSNQDRDPLIICLFCSFTPKSSFKQNHGIRKVAMPRVKTTCYAQGLINR